MYRIEFMLRSQIHQALGQVQQLQRKILEKQRFKGYSGRARAISGTVAFGASILMSTPYFPKSYSALLGGWSNVLIFSLVLNFGAILYWFLFDPAAQRDVRRLRPTIDVVPPLIVGFVLSLTMVFSESYSYLYGIWMCMFGLANLAGRHVLPRAISFVGMFYVTCGALLLLAFPVSFLNPWPMGLVFFAGEWAAGVVLHFDAEPRPAFRSFFHVKENYHAEAK